MRFNVSTPLRTVARRLTLPLVGLVAGVAGAGAVTAMLPATYLATASVIIMPASTEASAVTLAQNVAPAMARVARSREVAQLVGAAVGVSTEDMLGHINGTSELGVPIVTLTATATTANQAAAAANAAADALRQISKRLLLGGQPAVAVQNLNQADPPADPLSPTFGLNLALGGFVGLLIGLGLKFWRSRVNGIPAAAGPAPELFPSAGRPAAWPVLTDNLGPLSSDPRPGDLTAAAYAQRPAADAAASAGTAGTAGTAGAYGASGLGATRLDAALESAELGRAGGSALAPAFGAAVTDSFSAGSFAGPEPWRGWQQATPPQGTQRSDLTEEFPHRAAADAVTARPTAADRPPTKGPANRPADRFSADRRRTEALRANQLRASQLRQDRRDAGDTEGEAAGESQPDYLTNDPFATDEETP